ncbi:Cell surface superoxide dismutase Cu-Zn 6 [Spathaspora sp. JA1]|nr:Cell surface superoxide dismutase Cu-Zn 6 [Spathaspora sp. JA1]
MKILPIIISLTSLLAFTQADKAPKVKKNPKDVVAIADFPFGGNTNVRGNVVFTAKQGTFVNVNVDMTGLPAEGGPFFYHIHEGSVPADGNCEAVGLHFNPYNAPPVCNDQKHDGYCQVGDLSGKHGAINTTCFEAKYEDSYLSLNAKSKSYIIGKSVVFHYSNLTKFACADIAIADELRVETLINEYTQSGEDLIQLQELKQPLEEGYQFDELEALTAEVYESEELSHTNKTHEYGHKRKNSTLFTGDLLNKSNIYHNVSQNQYGPDCGEDGVPSAGNSLCVPIILGIFAGLFI